MKIIFLTMLLFAASALSPIKAQGLQPGECGIRFTYDATGALVLREFICNNSGVVMFRSANNKDSAAVTTVSKSQVAAEDIVTVSSVMPNPTTGRFTVLLSRTLKNERVLLLDANGKVLQKRRESGNTIAFDISALAPGMYFINIVGGPNASTFKVVKQ